MSNIPNRKQIWFNLRSCKMLCVPLKLAVACTLAIAACIVTQTHAYATRDIVAFDWIGENVHIQDSPETIRASMVVVRLHMLEQAEVDDTIVLDLFDGDFVLGTVRSMERRGPGMFTCYGELLDHEAGYFVIVGQRGAAAGQIAIPLEGRTYDLHYLDEDLYALRQIDQSLLGECAGGKKFFREDQVQDAAKRNRAPDLPGGGDQRPTGTCDDIDPVVDALIVYSDDARRGANGTNQIEAACLNAVVLANVAYDASGINVRIRLVYMDEVTYNESGRSINDDLDFLIDPNDGVLDDVHNKRDDYSADVVTLIVEDRESCGLGTLIAEEDTAFSIVVRSCLAGHSYAHEIGHNFGCEHNREDATLPPLYTWSYGWRFIGDSSTPYCTVMSYRDDGTYTRIPRFSNPDIDFDGQPTGVPIGDTNEAHNANTINDRRDELEAFRMTRFDLWVDFSYGGSEIGTYGSPYDTVTEGYNAIIVGNNASEIPNLFIKAGSTSETIVFGKPMLIRSCGGSAIIGE